eukprot:TRINITY_DN3991_c0_g1_i2.p1 TRINITY_DN3991_c0_g1~~TRINITY_DN3991_c0_g1_i2.p1  ORF type:complete len:216 (-),score=26.39 TRINITY_DN3991_c0_g1_i2:110-715(-)
MSTNEEEAITKKIVEVKNPTDPQKWEPNTYNCQIETCKVAFGYIYPRPHHCRSCGKCICDLCSSLSGKVGEEIVRICTKCYDKLSRYRPIFKMKYPLAQRQNLLKVLSERQQIDSIIAVIVEEIGTNEYSKLVVAPKLRGYDIKTKWHTDAEKGERKIEDYKFYFIDETDLEDDAMVEELYAAHKDEEDSLLYVFVKEHSV